MSTADLAVFNAPDEAREAYFKDGGTGVGSEDANGWQQAQEVDRLQGGWVLFSQQRVESDKTRWFVLGGPDGGQVLRKSGAPEPIPEGASFDELPSMETEDAARSAHEKWLGSSEQQQRQWGPWGQLGKRPPWVLYSRSQTSGDQQQWIAKGVLEDGTEVHLAADGTVQEDMNVFDSRQALETALAAYQEKAERGDVPEPTGRTPSTPEGGPSGSSGGPGGTLGSIGSIVTSNPLIAVGAMVVIWYLYRQYGGELIDG